MSRKLIIKADEMLRYLHLSGQFELLHDTEKEDPVNYSFRARPLPTGQYAHIGERDLTVTKIGLAQYLGTASILNVYTLAIDRSSDVAEAIDFELEP